MMSQIFFFFTTLNMVVLQMMDMREAVEEASDSQALKQIESQVWEHLFDMYCIS